MGRADRKENPVIELIFTACSIVQGAHCREVSLVYSDISLITCATQAQQPIADWMLTHPNWTVSRWQCRPAGQYARI